MHFQTTVVHMWILHDLLACSELFCGTVDRIDDICVKSLSRLLRQLPSNECGRAVLQGDTNYNINIWLDPTGVQNYTIWIKQLLPLCHPTALPAKLVAACTDTTSRWCNAVNARNKPASILHRTHMCNIPVLSDAILLQLSMGCLNFSAVIQGGYTYAILGNQSNLVLPWRCERHHFWLHEPRGRIILLQSGAVLF